MRWQALVVLAVGLAAGCQTDRPARLNAPPQGQAARGHRLQEPYVAMVDNAALNDMSVADCHFVAHTDQISGLGLYRLQRLAEMLKVYGGTLRYDTRLDDGKLAAARLERLREYLAAAGCDMEKVSVELGMPGGEGMLAAEAIKAQQAPTGCEKANESLLLPLGGSAQ